MVKFIDVELYLDASDNSNSDDSRNLFLAQEFFFIQ